MIAAFVWDGWEASMLLLGFFTQISDCEKVYGQPQNRDMKSYGSTMLYQCGVEQCNLDFGIIAIIML